MVLILIIIALILDGIISIHIPINSMFLPLLTLTTIYSIYPKFKRKEKRYFIIIFLTGLIYDILYTNLLLFHALTYLFIGMFIKYIYKNYHQNIIKNIVYLIIVISLYELFTCSIFFIFQLTKITINAVVIKIICSIFINIIYLVLITPVLKLKS